MPESWGYKRQQIATQQYHKMKWGTEESRGDRFTRTQSAYEGLEAKMKGNETQ